MYVLWANMEPLMVLYHDGFIRQSLSEYEENSTDENIAITTMGFVHHTNTNTDDAETPTPTVEWNLTME
jgi:hypothetical protein